MKKLKIEKILFALVMLLVTLAGCKKETLPPTVSPLNTPPPDVVSDSPVPTPVVPDIVQTRIMFRSNRDGESRFYSMLPDGSDVQQMNFSQAVHTAPLIWISELQAFAAALNLDGQEDLYLVDIQGEVMQRLTTTPEFKGLPDYSSATEMFAFSCIRSDLDICTVPLQGGEIVNLTGYPSREDWPTWSPSGEQVIFVSNRDAIPDVWMVNRDGSDLRNMTHTGQPHGDPRWSPDGEKILFTSQRDFNWEVYVMDADGKNPINLSNNPAQDMTPRWSPDGEYITFRSNRTGDDDIYIAKADGTEPVNVTNLQGSEEYVFVWSPDGESIVFTSDADGDIDVYTVNRDGTGLENLTNGSTDDSSPQWINY